MEFNNVVIEASAKARPAYFLSSDELENKLSDVYNRLKLPFGRIQMQTGIESRGHWDPGTLPSSIATLAAKNLFEESNIDPNSIDLLIFSSVCRDQLEPSSASSVHNNLNLRKDCTSFDLSNACLGFMSAMMIAASQIELGVIKKALIVSGENSGPLILKTIEKLTTDLSISRKDFKKYFANLTIGSAGVAMVLTHKSVGSGLQLKRAISLSDTQSVSLCRGGGDTNELMMETDSEKLLHAGVALATEAWEQFKNETEFNHVISHQVGIAHRNLLYDKLKIDLKKDFSTFSEYGNTGSSAVILTLHEFLNTKKLKASDSIALLGIGSGLHTIMMELYATNN